MTGYAPDHASALADVSAAGRAVTFTFISSTHAPATGTFSAPVTTSLRGYAARVQGDPKRYAALGLTVTTGLTLLFVPTGYGGTPEPGYSVTWSGRTFTVKECDPVAPDGSVIVTRVICGR